MSYYDINQAQMIPSVSGLSDADYASLAEFRYSLRKFLEFSEKAAASEGLTPQQHQAMLVIRGTSGASSGVGRLAERLCIRPNTAAELVNRLEALGMVIRRASIIDRRQVEVTLTDLGSEKLETLSKAHRQELSQIRPVFRGLLESLEEA